MSLFRRPPCFLRLRRPGYPLLEGGCPRRGLDWGWRFSTIILPVRAPPVRTCLVLRAQSAQLCLAQITRTVMLVIHDEHHSEPLTERPRRATDPQRSPGECRWNHPWWRQSSSPNRIAVFQCTAPGLCRGQLPAADRDLRNAVSWTSAALKRRTAPGRVEPTTRITSLQQIRKSPAEVARRGNGHAEVYQRRRPVECGLVRAVK